MLVAFTTAEEEGLQFTGDPGQRADVDPGQLSVGTKKTSPPGQAQQEAAATTRPRSGPRPHRERDRGGDPDVGRRERQAEQAAGDQG